MTMRLMVTAVLIVAGACGPALAGERGAAKRSYHYAQAYGAVSAPVSFAGARGFAGWPTDYLTNRFGDRQQQGR
jgi:hypothetical protein